MPASLFFENVSHGRRGDIAPLRAKAGQADHGMAVAHLETTGSRSVNHVTMP
jgi:hypothetical protein